MNPIVKKIFTGLIIFLVITAFVFINLGNIRSIIDKKPSLNSVTVDSNYQFPYNLNNPAGHFKLPKDLTEISGITEYGNNYLLCVQDEKGKIYVYDLTEHEIVEEVKFYEKGDFEDIALVGDDIYVLKSNGTLYRVTDFNLKSQNTEKIKTHLTDLNNTEGLTYDSTYNQLLIACKGLPGKTGKDYEGHKAIYAFDLDSMELEREPYVLISSDSIKKFIYQDATVQFVEDINQFVDPITGSFTILPSAIAIHPSNNYLYILSSPAELLIVMDRQGNLKHLQKLELDLFIQPEGMTFLRNGTLLISNEGKKGKGNIMFFPPIK